MNHLFNVYLIWLSILVGNYGKITAVISITEEFTVNFAYSLRSCTNRHQYTNTGTGTVPLYCIVRVEIIRSLIISSFHCLYDTSLWTFVQIDLCILLHEELRSRIFWILNSKSKRRNNIMLHNATYKDWFIQDSTDLYRTRKENLR